MSKLRILICCFSLSLIFLGCGESPSKETATSKAIKQGDEIQIDLLTEKHYAYIKELIREGEQLFIKVDYVDFLTGKEAIDAEWRDQAYFVEGEDTISNITDGYYISNVNPKIRTFIVGENAQAEYTIDGMGTHRMEQAKYLNLSQLEEYVNTEALLMLHVKEGVVLRIDEQFIP